MSATRPVEPNSPQRAPWLVLVAALALIVIVALVVTIVARGGSGSVELFPTATSYLDPVQTTATAQASLMPQRYAPTGIGPCVTAGQPSGAAGVAMWNWTTTPGLVTCPGGGVTRLYSGASISFAGFQKAGFPQVALVTAIVSFHPGVSHDLPYPEPTLTPGQIPCLSATFNGATSFARDSDGIRFCNNASYITLQPPEYGQTTGFVNEEPTPTSYSLAMGLTLSGSNYALDDQPLAGQQVTHGATDAVTFSTASDMPAGSYVDIQNFVITPQQTS